MEREPLSYLTEAQEYYLRDREESKKYCNPFKSYLRQIEKYWADLEQPEASWDIRDLRASGKPVKDLAPYLLAHYAVFLGKLAMRRGMKVTLDTLDCPQELMGTDPTDYSYLELPRPKDGFPWERKG